MGLMERRHWQAALAAMVLCGVAMPVMAETDTPVVVSTAGTTVSGDINVAGTTSSGGSTLYALRVSDAASGGTVTLQNKVRLTLQVSGVRMTQKPIVRFPVFL